MSASAIHAKAIQQIKPRMQCSCEPLELRHEKGRLECAHCGKALKDEEKKP